MLAKIHFDSDIPIWAVPLRVLYRVIRRAIPSRLHLKHFERKGIHYIAWINEDIGKKLLLLRSYERQETSVIKRLVHPGDTCIDVGGNIGYYSLNLAALSGPAGRVYVFEPIERNALVIKLASILNRFRNIEVLPYAVTDSEQEVSLGIPEDDTGYAYVVPSETCDSVKVKSLTLDSFVEQRNLDRVTFIKVDVEGAEALVLKGARRLLSDPIRGPRAVMVELIDEYLSRFNSTSHEVKEYMASLGFLPYYADQRGCLQSFEQWQGRRILNVFFLRNGVTGC
jgi:FkbM family methyltransferase